MKTTKAHLLNSLITIDYNSTLIGGAWQGKDKSTGLPCPWDPVSLSFFLEKLKEVPNAFVLDIGANTGIYCLLPTINSSIRGYAFEPNPEYFNILNNNIVLNNLQNNISTLPYALSDKEGFATLKIPSSGTDSGLACIGNPQRYHDWKEITVKQDTLDHIAQVYNFPKIDFIKIDTEGCELFILKGAKELLERDHPQILLELEDRNTSQFGYSTSEIIVFLESIGYTHVKVSDSDAFFSHKCTPILNTYSAIKNSSFSLHTSKVFSHWIDVIKTIDRRLYFRDQSPESIQSLIAIAQEIKPTLVIELGTLTGISLRVWLNATENIPIHAFDYRFDKLIETSNLFPIDFSRVHMHPGNILNVDFKNIWTESDRVLFFIDAHDMHNTPIMNHVIENVFPHLPKNSRVVVDDLWHIPERVTTSNADIFFNNNILHNIDELQCFEGHFAPYHAGGSFFGFLEVIPFMNFVNQYSIQLKYEDNGKHVWFEWDKHQHMHTKPIDYLSSDLEWGVVDYNPLKIYSSKELTKRTLQDASILYAKGLISESLNKVIQLTQTEVTQESCIALSICSARLGNLDEAYEFLRIANKFPDSNILVKRLQKDLESKFGIVNQVEQKDEGVTIFALPKAFTGHIGVIQRNAILSWTKLTPKPKIILFGSDSGVQEMANEIGALHIPDIMTNELGTPLIADIFDKAAIISRTKILAYVNSDMILLNDFMHSIENVQKLHNEFLIIGQRWDLCITDSIDFSKNNWQDSILQERDKNGFLHYETGIDYFIHTTGFWNGIPPFAIGRSAWDNWLVMQPISKNKTVIDATRYINAIHQEHGYSHTGNREIAFWGMEAKRNRSMANLNTENGLISSAKLMINESGSIIPRPITLNQYNNTAAKIRRLKWAITQAHKLKNTGCNELISYKFEEAGNLIPLEILDKL